MGFSANLECRQHPRQRRSSKAGPGEVAAGSCLTEMVVYQRKELKFSNGGSGRTGDFDGLAAMLSVEEHADGQCRTVVCQRHAVGQGMVPRMRTSADECRDVHGGESGDGDSSKFEMEQHGEGSESEDLPWIPRGTRVDPTALSSLIALSTTFLQRIRDKLMVPLNRWSLCVDEKKTSFEPNADRGTRRGKNRHESRKRPKVVKFLAAASSRAPMAES
ncbi:hypothetical protein DFH09DRAFT_1080778 [Mycena vulgaris]|nr:hypothetical protein DFH09DRAFT_1080778 [Mycena vulgaris]